MKYLLIVFLLLVFPFVGHSMPVYAVIYANGAANLDALTTAQKVSIRDRYVPQSVLDSQAWADASAAEQWTWIKDNIIPEGFKRKVAKYGVLPILYHETAGFSIFQNWWKLAQEGSKYVYLVFLDYNSSYSHIKSWLDTQAGLKYWWGPTAWDAFRNLWNDRADPISAAILRRVIRYPVETDDEGAAVAPGAGTGGETMVIIQTALDLGYAIETDVLTANKDRIIPFRILGH